MGRWGGRDCPYAKDGGPGSGRKEEVAKRARQSLREENIRLYGTPTRPKKNDPFRKAEQNAKVHKQLQSFVKK